MRPLSGVALPCALGTWPTVFEEKIFASKAAREEKNSRMNVTNFIFYKSLRSFLPFGPNFCGGQGRFRFLTIREEMLKRIREEIAPK